MVVKIQFKSSHAQIHVTHIKLNQDAKSRRKNYYSRGKKGWTCYDVW